MLDPRLNAIRPDLADRRLDGHVRADRFVDGRVAVVTGPTCPLMKAPRADSGLETEALHGDALRVFEERADGWAWVQCVRDAYVGYAPLATIEFGERPAPTHKVAALRTFLHAGTSIKIPASGWLSYGSELTVEREVEDRGRRFGITHRGLAIASVHLAPIDRMEPDAVAIAERLVGTPYLWGGKSSLGIDCSGLVQTCLRGVGIEVPRDADMQESMAGERLPLDPSTWRRGDLLFWPGHVAFVHGPQTIIHANGRALAVSIEPVAEALRRIAADGTPLRSVIRPAR